MSGSAALTGLGHRWGSDLEAVGRRTRAVARVDEDVVTMAVEAAATALPDDIAEVGALILASTTPPYARGGSAQLVAELLDLHGSLFTAELAATPRDGLAAIRLAVALAPSHGNVLVVAAHRGEGIAGSGAIALLVSDGTHPAAEPLASLRPLAGFTSELRDEWQLRGDPTLHAADPSFVDAIGTTRLAEELLGLLPTRALPITVTGPHARAAAAVERQAGGPGDRVIDHFGALGSAHPLARLITTLDAPHVVTAMASGMGDALLVEPTPHGTEVAASLVGALLRDLPVPAVHAAAQPPEGFHPYASVPRAWRERDVDLRLRGIVDPARPAPGRLPATGTVVTWTRDHVYPAGEPIEVVAVDLDHGGRFFGQVAAGEHVAIGDRVELAPRRLHAGSGIVQYFWKARPCR